MTPPAARLFTLILLLQRQPNQKAAGLAEKLGVSVRTLHRYLEMLDEMGIPVYSERGPLGGFSLVRGYRLPPLVFTPQEATAIYLGAGLVEELWGSLYRQGAEGVLAKLDNLLPEEQRQEAAWARRSLVATGLNRSNLESLAPRLEMLRRAVREQRTLSLLYRSSSHPQPHRRQLDPYALVHRWGWWYAVGYCHLRNALRSLRVDRMEELSLAGPTFTVQPGFDVRTYLSRELEEQPRVGVRLRFSAAAAPIAQANPSMWDSLEEQADGALVAFFSAPDLGWAASSVLAYGPVVEVLDPPELRQLVAEWAQAVAKMYVSGNP